MNKFIKLFSQTDTESIGAKIALLKKTANVKNLSLMFIKDRNLGIFTTTDTNNHNGAFGGTIIDINKWKILTHMTPKHKTVPYKNIKRDVVSQISAVYNINKVYDGTTCCIYPYYVNDELRWGISTYNGFDLTNTIRCGEKTYGQLINEILFDDTSPTFDPSEYLDSNFSYTIGFVHRNIHPMSSNTVPHRAWLYYAWDINNNKICNENPFKLPTYDAISSVYDKGDKITDLMLDDSMNDNNDFCGFLVKTRNINYFYESEYYYNLKNTFYVKIPNNVDKTRWIKYCMMYCVKNDYDMSYLEHNKSMYEYYKKIKEKMIPEYACQKN
jgi:hypothetical protein